MKEIRRNGMSSATNNNSYRAAAEFVGTDAERLAMTDMVPGDEFTVVDETTHTVEGIYLYSGLSWCTY